MKPARGSTHAPTSMNDIVGLSEYLVIGVAVVLLGAALVLTRRQTATPRSDPGATPGLDSSQPARPAADTHYASARQRPGPTGFPGGKIDRTGRYSPAAPCSPRWRSDWRPSSGTHRQTWRRSGCYWRSAPPSRCWRARAPVAAGTRDVRRARSVDPRWGRVGSLRTRWPYADWRGAGR